MHFFVLTQMFSSFQKSLRLIGVQSKQQYKKQVQKRYII